MPLVLAPLLVGFAAIAGVLVMYGMHEGMTAWLRPLLKAIPDKQSFFGKVFRLTPVFGLAKGIGWVFHKVRHDLSHALVARLAPLAAWLTALGTRVEMQNHALANLAEQTVNALFHLHHHSTPVQIKKAVVPVKAQAVHAQAIAHGADVLGHDTRRLTFKGIDHLKSKWVIPLAIFARGIDRLLKDHVIPRVNADHRAIGGVIAHDIPGIRAREKVLGRTQRAHARRLSRLEKLLGLGVITALLVRVLARVAPWLFCRNWKRVGRQVCSMDSSLLSSLLTDALLFTGTLSIVEFAKECQAFTGTAESGIKFLVNELHK